MLSNLRRPEHGAQLERCAMGAEQDSESLGRQVLRHAGSYAVLIQTLLTCRYSLIISAPFSRPMPLAL